MATSATSITSLQAVKRYLRLTTSDDDRLLTELLDAATDRIEKFCQRVFVTQDYKQFISGSGMGSLSLPNYPVTSIRRLGWDRKNAFTVSATTEADLRATVEVQDDQLVLKRWTLAGVGTETSITFSAKPTVGDLVAQINLTTGWSATSNENVLTDELLRQGGQDAKTNSAQIYYLKSSDADYRVDEDTGRVDLLSAQFESQWYPFDPNAMIFPRGSNNIFVDYTAGYTQETVPMALQEIAWELVASAYHGGKHDPTVASESLDGYSYSTRSSMELRDDQMRRMYIYRRNAE
tara:strand:- start:13000 stop:13875 length:876 start_codon:yes stop_codon:yes gene_type:complete